MRAAGRGGVATRSGRAIDPSRAYLWRGPRGLRLALFFYDGPISRAIAFEGVLERGERLAARLPAAFSDDAQLAQLVHVATDGESYGHHHRFGEMALAAALRTLAADRDVELTNYGAFLAAHPPTHGGADPQGTRGRARTASSAGAPTAAAACGVDWHQRWRAPLREALDWLREQRRRVLRGAGRRLSARSLGRPRRLRRRASWTASPRRLEASCASTSAVAARRRRAAVEVRRLLELQRNRLLMYTSCGWFFDEISGLEPVQVLRYAAIVLQYLRDLGGGHHEPELERRLAAAPSNVVGLRRRPRGLSPAGGAGWSSTCGASWRTTPSPISSTEHPDEAAVYAYRVTRLDQAREANGGTALRIAHVRVQSQVTGEAREVMYALLHFGGHDVTCALRAWEGQAAYDRMKDDLLGRFARYSLADMVRGIDEHFPGETFALPHLFLDERRRVLARVIASVLAKHEETYRRIWEEEPGLVRYLRQADAPIPEALAIVARHVLEQEAWPRWPEPRRPRRAAPRVGRAGGRGARAGAEARPHASPAGAAARAGLARSTAWPESRPPSASTPRGDSWRTHCGSASIGACGGRRTGSSRSGAPARRHHARRADADFLGLWPGDQQPELVR